MSEISTVGAEAEQLEDKSLRMMDSTIELISRDGLAAVRLQDIAAHAGVSVGAIQYHFASRADLIDRALLRHARQMLDAITIEAGDLAAWPALRQTLWAIARQSEIESKDRVWVMLNASALTSMQHLKLVQSIQKRWQGLFRDLVARGISTGDFRPVASAEDIVEQFIIGIDGFAINNAVHGFASSDAVEHLGGSLERLAIALLRPSHGLGATGAE